MNTATIETKEDLKYNILRHLKKGRANAIRKVDLAKLCETNERQMRLAIRELLDDGFPVCGSPHPPYGYYIAGDTEELKEEMRLIRNGYGMELLRRYSALRKCLKKMESVLPMLDNGQLSLKF